jgi:adenylosuccinate synthase
MGDAGSVPKRAFNARRAPTGRPYFYALIAGAINRRWADDMTRRPSEHACVFGLGWGDEGKGKVVDLLCPAFDIVIRFNGGANAGHTVCVGNETFALHLLPTGVLHDNAVGVIGPGVVVDPIALLAEIDALKARGVDAASRLKISDRAHLVLAYHKIEDQLSERSAGAEGKIGTTSRGIGPCYADKMRRTTAVRFADLVDDKELTPQVRRIVDAKKACLGVMYGEDGGLDAQSVLDDLATAASRLRSNICDTTQFLNDAIEGGRSLLFEGANGMLLDVDHGTYPFVTSSSTGPNGIGPGAGVPASLVTRLIGVSKAYATRVGAGPFVSELNDAVGERIRQRGREFGTTTGRPRRCGWFDAVTCRYTAQLSGATDLALLHLDTLSGLDEIGVCVAYRCDGRTVRTVPASVSRLERAEPIIEFLPGWQEDLRSVRRFEDLPKNARDYVERIEALVGVPASLVGVGPDRSQTLVRGTLQALVKSVESVGSEK